MRRKLLFSAISISALFAALFFLQVGCGGGGGSIVDETNGGKDGLSDMEKIGGSDTSALEQVADEGGVSTDSPDASTSPDEFVAEELIAEEAAVEEAAPEPEPVPQPPQVVSTTPKDGEKVEQPPNKPIIITVVFDQEMDPTTLNNSAIDIQPNTPGTAKPGSDGKSLVFTPDNPLQLFKKYTVTIKNTVKSKAGINMQKDYTFSFETKAPGSEPNFLSTFSSAGGILSDGNYTHYTSFGCQCVVVGKMGDKNTHQVYNGFIYTFTY